jgi:2-oxoglutarate dehydrogenase E2 component (dihydrolipoamide succinyltransferase)
MAVAIKVPSVGESITEGTIARWLKKEGDAVRQDDPLFELETEKATSTVPAPAAGVLHINVKEGETVAVGAEVGHIDPDGKPAPAPAKADKVQQPAAREPAPLSPAVRHLVAEKGLKPEDVPATGRGGRLTKEDVVNFLGERERQAPVPVPEPAPPAPAPAVAAAPADRRETRQRMTAIRQRIGDRLLASQKNTATLTTFNEADLSAVLGLRGQYKDRFKEHYQVSLGFMSFFVKACALALRDFPVVNSRIDGNEIITPQYCNIGVAVSSEKGLMVPVIRDADKLSFAQVEKAIAELASRARDGTITVADLQGGTFTITNGGVFGSLVSTPILNPPQSAILGMHSIQKRPVVVDDQIVIRPMMYLALSYDHRLIDGRDAVLFLVRVKECVENPERLLLEV